MDWSPIIAGGVAGLATGVLGSLVAPWVQLAVENRRESRVRRRQQIATWRAMVGRHLGQDTAVFEDPDYVSLRNYLQPDALSRVEQSGNRLVLREGAQGISADDTLAAVADDIARLERKWGLA